MNEERVTEIKSQITAFSKDTYTKSEYLPELLKLQKELVGLTLKSKHSENATLRLRDIEKYLCELNNERGHVADHELAKFMQGSKEICNNISAELSGNNGEQKVFKELQHLNCQNGVLRNVEFEFDGRRTEIDAIVFTNHAIFIIEIKNSKKNIFIDEYGELYRIGSSMHHDGNIAEKMRIRETMLRKALDRAGMSTLKIFKILAFTNPRIDVENKYHYIKVCGSNYLPIFIEKFTNNHWYTYEDICTMMEAVTEVRCTDEYQMTIDMNEFKTNYAILMAKLEDFTQSKEVSEKDVALTNPIKQQADTSDEIKHKNRHSILFEFGRDTVAAAIAVLLVSTAITGISKLMRK